VNTYAQCDFKGNQFLLLEAIVDHRTDSHAVKKVEIYVYNNGQQSLPKTNKLPTRTSMFGIRIPRTCDEAIILD
jgi:hypothetical protein